VLAAGPARDGRPKEARHFIVCDGRTPRGLAGTLAGGYRTGSGTWVPASSISLRSTSNGAKAIRDGGVKRSRLKPHKDMAPVMQASLDSDEMDMRRRRALWRATHRGTKELDILLGTYAGNRLAEMDTAELARFEQFLLLQEAELQAWLLSPKAADDVPFADIINAVRAFHGMSAA